MIPGANRFGARGTPGAMQANPPLDELWSVDRLAAYLDAPKCYVYRLTREHRIAFVRVGRELRFRTADVEAWLASSVVPAKAAAPPRSPPSLTEHSLMPRRRPLPPGVALHARVGPDTYEARRRRQIHEPKTSTGRRVVPTLTRSVGERLAAMIAERGLATGDWLFTGRGGGPLTPDNWRARVWRPAVASAGLADPQPTPHALRHTAVALWIATGTADPLILARWAGHSSITITYDLYGHLLPHDAASTREALDALRVPTGSAVVDIHPIRGAAVH